MKGRALQLLKDFEASFSGARASFMRSRLILQARLVPDQLTAETDDPDLERRMEDAIARIKASINQI